MHSHRNYLEPRIRVAAGLVEEAVPNYDIKQSDPVIAAASGIGNCVSKAIIGGLLLERAKLLGPPPALAWNTHTHPKIGDDLFGRTRILNGHAQLVVANAKYGIHAVSFNPDGIEANNWEVFDFNEDEAYAYIDDKEKIQTTQKGIAVGFVIKDWYEGGKMYHEALGENSSVFHTLSQQEISRNVVSSLVSRNLLLTIAPL